MGYGHMVGVPLLLDIRPRVLTPTPPPAPPPHRHLLVWLPSGQYESYWNAFLFEFCEYSLRQRLDMINHCWFHIETLPFPNRGSIYTFAIVIVWTIAVVFWGMNSSGGSRISPRLGAPTHQGRGRQHTISQNFPKTAWNWNSLEPRGHPSRPP